MSTEVIVENIGSHVEVVLNRPERKNAVTRALAEQLRDALQSAGSDPATGCILLRGAGGSFCSGMDLKAVGADLSNEPLDAWIAVHAAIYTCNAPIVVALERFAINAGAALVLATPIVVAGSTSFLQVSEIAMGVGAPMNQAWLHLRHSGAVGDRITLLGDRIPSTELLRLGVVTEVVDDELVLDRARELADRIGSFPSSGRRAIASTWKALRGELEDPLSWFTQLMRSNARPTTGETRSES